MKSDPKKSGLSLTQMEEEGGGKLTQVEEEEGKLTQVEESGLGRDRWLRGGFSLIPSGINTNTHIQWRYAVFYCHQHKGSHISFCALIFTIRSKSMVIKSRLLTQLEDTWVYIN